MNPIVIVNVTQTIAPTPSTLQETGAMISQGGTTLSAGTYSLLRQYTDLASILAASLAITSLSWGGAYGGQVTVTTTAPHGIAVNEPFVTTIADAVPAAYNGTYDCIATGSSTFTYYLASNPGSETTPGTYSPRNVAELQAMATTFFAQGAQNGIYVLELGAGEPAAGVTALTNFINNTIPQFFYSYLVPRDWDGVSQFLTFLANFEATTSKTYFFITTTPQNYGLYTALMKDVMALMEAPFYGAWAANALTAGSWSGGLATVTTTTNHGVSPGQFVQISGCTPAGYNGRFMALPGTTASTLIYAVAADPGGSISVDGTLVASIAASAGVPSTEFTHASDWWTTINYDPSSTNKITSLIYAEGVGVTPFPQRGNGSFTTTLQAAHIGFFATGSEGGISNAVLYGGKTMDGKPFNYWYATDWMQINVDLALSNVIINGSNNPINPLYYNQDGINRLQAAAAATAASAITFGMAVGRVIQTRLDPISFTNNLNAGLYAGQVVINAVPFTTYLTANPSDYSIGKYGGLSLSFTPVQGFENIVFNINVSNFPIA